MSGEQQAKRRFTIEEIDNAWLLKVSELGSDKLVGRSAYLDISSLMTAVQEFLTKN